MGEEATNKPPRPVRKRPIMQAVWLTEDEWRHVQDRMALTRSRSFGAFARAALLDGAVTVHEALDVSALRPELSRIGNNVNQITAKINADAFRSYNFEDMIDGQKMIYEQLLSIARKG